MGDSKMKSMTGTYDVTITQPLRGETITYNILGEIQEDYDSISGRFIFHPRQTGRKVTSELRHRDKHYLNCRGFREGDHVQLNYNNTMAPVAQFGAAIMTIVSEHEMVGKIVGHSPENQSIMIVEVTMRRQPEQ